LNEALPSVAAERQGVKGDRTNMNENTTTTPRRLIASAITDLEKQFGSRVYSICLKLLAANELLLRSELALYADPEREWPTVAPVVLSTQHIKQRDRRCA
jgi:hypothetical protein